jgi:hypothetical protein
LSCQNLGSERAIVRHTAVNDDLARGYRGQGYGTEPSLNLWSSKPSIHSVASCSMGTDSAAGEATIPHGCYGWRAGNFGSLVC